MAAAAKGMDKVVVHCRQCVYMHVVDLFSENQGKHNALFLAARRKWHATSLLPTYYKICSCVLPTPAAVLTCCKCV